MTERNDMNKRRSRDQPQTIAGEVTRAANELLVQPRRQGKGRGATQPLVIVDSVALSDVSYRAGEADGHRADADTAPLSGSGQGAGDEPPTAGARSDGHLSHVLTQSIAQATYRLGEMAEMSLAAAIRSVSAPIAHARTGLGPISDRMLLILLLLFGMAEVAAGYVAINLVFKQSPVLSVIIAVTIAMILAFTGFLLAQTLLRILPGKLVLGVAALLSVLLIGALAYGSVAVRAGEETVRNAEQAQQDAVQVELLASTDAERVGAQAALDQANEQLAVALQTAQRGTFLLFVGMIGLPIAAGLMAKALQLMDKERLTLRLTAGVQQQRSKDVAAARASVAELRSLLSTAGQLAELRVLVWNSYLAGYRSAVPADVADRLSMTPPQLSPAPEEPVWIGRLSAKIAELEGWIDRAEQQPALALHLDTPEDLLAVRSGVLAPDPAQLTAMVDPGLDPDMPTDPFGSVVDSSDAAVDVEQGPPRAAGSHVIDGSGR